MCWGWDLIILAQFQGSKMSPALFQDFMDGQIKPLRFLNIVWSFWLRGNQDDPRLDPMGSQFRFPFYEICVQNQWKHEILRPNWGLRHWPLHKKWSFSWRISSVNVTKCAGNCRFDHIYWRNPNGKLNFMCNGRFDFNYR